MSYATWGKMGGGNQIVTSQFFHSILSNLVDIAHFNLNCLKIPFFFKLKTLTLFIAIKKIVT